MDNDYEIKSLFIILPKISVFVKSYHGKTKWLYF